MRVATNRAGILLAIMRPGQLKTKKDITIHFCEVFMQFPPHVNMLQLVKLHFYLPLFNFICKENSIKICILSHFL